MNDAKYAHWYQKYKGVYDGDANNYLLEDKLEMKVVRHYLWNHGKYTLELVCIGSVHITMLFYMGSVWFRMVK